MDSSAGGRALIAGAARTVVKVGSSSLTRRGRLEPARLDALVDALAARRQAGQQVVLVSSGAIAAGIAPLGLRGRPRDLATQQAAASVGQLLLAERYAASFARYGRTVGQVLLTADDLHRRGALPQRGAHPGTAAGARRDPDRQRERHGRHPGDPVRRQRPAGGAGGAPGARRRAGAALRHRRPLHRRPAPARRDRWWPRSARPPTWRRCGWPVRARRWAPAAWPPRSTPPRSPPAPASRCCSPPPTGSARRWPAAGGSYFAPTGKRTASRLFWLRHATTPRGRLVLDAGAVTAVLTRRVSLLTAGIVAVSGDFSAGDPVELADEAGRVLARGLVGFDSEDLPDAARQIQPSSCRPSCAARRCTGTTW